METPNYGRWSDLPVDILISLFGRLSYADFHRAKIVCRDWYLCSKQTLHRKTKGPRLVRSREDGYVLCSPNENRRVYKSKRDFSNTRFLSYSGNLVLMLDSESNLSIIDIFSEKRINLPPLDSIKIDHFTLKRIGDKEFSEKFIKRTGRIISRNQNWVNLKGHLWVNEKKNEEYTVAWFFDTNSSYIAFCKNGEDYYGTIPGFEYRRMKRNLRKLTWPSSESSSQLS